MRIIWGIIESQLSFFFNDHNNTKSQDQQRIRTDKIQFYIFRIFIIIRLYNRYDAISQRDDNILLFDFHPPPRPCFQKHVFLIRKKKYI